MAYEASTDRRRRFVRNHGLFGTRELGSLRRDGPAPDTVTPVPDRFQVEIDGLKKVGLDTAVIDLYKKSPATAIAFLDLMKKSPAATAWIIGNPDAAKKVIDYMKKYPASAKKVLDFLNSLPSDWAAALFFKWRQTATD